MMPQHVPLFPDQASSVAPAVDYLYFYLIAVNGLMALVLAVLVIAFAIRYRRRSAGEIPDQSSGNMKIEVGWTVGTLVLFLTMFFWSATVYFGMEAPPKNGIELYAVGKQWMWKIQHPEGQREINSLHVPLGKPVQITLTSQDVIHSFYIPAFRVKQDAVPGRYTTIWFTATKPGQYHLFCAEYCGTQHSRMIGQVYVMEPEQYAAWLATGGAEGSLSSKGEKLFHQHGCNVCHDLQGRGPAPSLKNVFGHSIRLDDGSSVIADESYVRQSVLQPNAKVVYGFRSIMPTFEGQVSEDDLVCLVAFVKALGREPAGPEDATPLAAPEQSTAGQPSTPASGNPQKTR